MVRATAIAPKPAPHPGRRNPAAQVSARSGAVTGVRSGSVTGVRSGAVTRVRSAAVTGTRSGRVAPEVLFLLIGVPVTIEP